MVFVFGSNLAGRHGKGSALEAAKKHGAVKGQAVGLQGDSYAIPTKDSFLKPLPIWRIRLYVDALILFAKRNPGMSFGITRIGCGLAGYDWETQVRPLFPEVLPPNCKFIDTSDKR